MPLLSTTLSDAILAFSDPQNRNFPGDAADTGKKWAAAFRTYFEGISNPVCLPIAHVTGEASCVSAMTPLVQATDGAAQAALAAGLQAYVVVIVANCAPYVATPPAGFILPSMPPTDSAVDAATILADGINTWAKTGMASIPPATASNWL